MNNKPKALVVDDTPFHRDFLKMFLRMKHYEVDIAEDGLEALERCKGCAYNLVFSDIEMPNMNGIEFLRSVKRLPQYARIPVVMISTLDDVEMKRKALGLGAFEYMVKPFNADKMDALFGKLS